MEIIQGSRVKLTEDYDAARIRGKELPVEYELFLQSLPPLPIQNLIVVSMPDDKPSNKVSKSKVIELPPTHPPKKRSSNSKPASSSEYSKSQHTIANAKLTAWASTTKPSKVRVVFINAIGDGPGSTSRAFITASESALAPALISAAQVILEIAIGLGASNGVGEQEIHHLKAITIVDNPNRTKLTTTTVKAIWTSAIVVKRKRPRQTLRKMNESIVVLLESCENPASCWDILNQQKMGIISSASGRNRRIVTNRP
ncbi:uncharacterized protein PAC_11664 [Phialocephala subalpina]|uniref:Uncharacterized protein n=1 Tax=Phialocephala subalpina TaxID=576137 RepID=A0A1L7X9W5_9HELO|nr:uncharacterized protein PAC_11664 [Phialocephala subalpina]